MFRKILIQAVAACGGKQESLAEKLNIAPGTLSKKINGESGFHEDEISKIIEIAGGCKKCKESYGRIISSYNTVMKCQVDRIAELEIKIQEGNGSFPLMKKKDSES